MASFSVLPYKKVTLEDMLTKDEADARSALVSSGLFFFLLLCACDHSSPPTSQTVGSSALLLSFVDWWIRRSASTIEAQRCAVSSLNGSRMPTW